jgi:PEP-CTERM motif
MKARNVMVLAVISAATLVVGTTAQAVVITNTTTGTTVFDSQGFENDVPGGAAATANPGFWSNGAASHDFVVTGGAPGAFEGANYMSSTRDSAGAGNVRAFLNAAETTAGDAIHAEWMMYITGPPLSDIGFFFTNAAGTNIGQARLGGNGLGTVQDSWSGVITPGVYVAGAWQKWELDYTIGATTSTVTVDSGAPVTLIVPGGAANSTGFGHLSLFHNGNQTFYLDSVPEPTTAGLVGLCGLGLVGRRRRQG